MRDWRRWMPCCIVLISTWITVSLQSTLTLPSFPLMKSLYPGYKHTGGQYSNPQLIKLIMTDTDHLLHDTSALRISYTLNRIGGVHALGEEIIRLSTSGVDSIRGVDGLQYIYHPIAYGPYLADKYGFPSVSKLHETDADSTKKQFWGKQGLLRVLTYTKHGNIPRGHVALWDCNQFYEAEDWIAGHELITVEFWEAPDSNCKIMPAIYQRQPNTRKHTTKTPARIEWPVNVETSRGGDLVKELHMNNYMRSIYRKYYYTGHKKVVPSRQKVVPKRRHKGLVKGHRIRHHHGSV